MPSILRTSTAAFILTVAGLLALTGCGDMSAEDTEAPASAEPSTVTTTADHEVTVEDLHDNRANDTNIDRSSIVCVDGSAFLYIYTSGYAKQGGPSIERFPEQDSSCDTQPKADDTAKEK